MSNKKIDRWMEPQLVPVLLVITVLFMLALGGGMPRGLGQDARMLLGAIGDAARFVSHVVDKTDNYFQRPPGGTAEHFVYARDEPACHSTAKPHVLKVRSPAGSGVVTIQELQIALPSVDALVEEALKARLKQGEVRGWPPLEALGIAPEVGETESVRILVPGTAALPHTGASASTKTRPVRG